MKMGPSGLRLLQGFERLRLEAYPDPGSIDGTPWTIGWGATTYEDGSPVRKGDVITAERADQLLLHHVERAEREVERLVKVAITPQQSDALISFEYNTGSLASSTLLRKLNAGDVAGAAAEFDRWVYNDGKTMEGLRRRRLAERMLFETVIPAPIEARTHPPAEPAPVTVEVKPVSPFIIPALDALITLAPTLGKLFKGDAPSKVAERNMAAFEAVADKVVPIVVAAAGAPNLQAAVEAAQSNTAVAKRIEQSVRESYAELHELSERSISQRQDFAVRWAAQRDVRTVLFGWTFIELLSAWLVISGTFAGWYVLWAGEGQFGNQMIGSVITLLVIGGVVAVRDFWIGTSMESRRKTDMLQHERDAK